MASITRIREVFEECHKGLNTHSKLVKKLRKIYDATNIDKFWEEFLRLLKFSMIVAKREPAVERTIEFAARFATSLVKKEEKKGEKEEVKESLAESEEDEDEEMHPFLLRFFTFLLDSHNANDKGVRFRVCQLINKLLNSMGEEAQIDDDLFDRIYECMLQRLRDKFPIVRVHAVLALTRLQDPRDMDCPVINAYLFLLSCDTNPDVRRAVLSCIAASTKTLPAILERTRDTKDVVRKLAYEVIAEKIHIKALTIAQRVRLLQDGLNDRVEMVKEACTSRLLQAWLRIYEANILELLKCLDVENSLETSEQALMCLLKKTPIAELVANFDVLDDRQVLSSDQLTPETVTYWRCLVEHTMALASDGEDHIDKILPTGTNYAAYMHSVLQVMKGERDVDVQLQNEFMLQQLLQLASSIDLTDEVGRRNMQGLLRTMLAEEEVTHSLVKPLLSLYTQLHTSPEARVNDLIEIISDIRMPITTVESQKAKDEQRRLEVKIAKVRVDLNQLREELDSCIQNQDFSKAAEIKAQVEELETTKSSLMEETMPVSQETRVEKTDVPTLLKCLTIAAEMLQDISFKRLIPSLQTLIESLILPGIQNADPAVRNLAVKALGLCCVVSRDTARAHLLLFVQVTQMDVDAVKVTALQVIFDLLLTFGMEAFQVDTSIEDSLDTSGTTNQAANTSGNNDGADSFAEMTQTGAALEEETTDKQQQQQQQQKQQNNVASILTILTNLLDCETSEVRSVAAEGLAKLMLSGRVLSAKLFMRLLLLWYNPVTEEDNYLRHCLGAFFPVYAFASKMSQEVVEAAFVPTLTTLLEAPSTSPLAEVNEANVAELLVQLTDHTHLLANQGGRAIPDVDSCPHDNIAIKLCNKILADPNSFDVRTLCKILNMLELCATNIATLTDLKVLVDSMLKEVKDQQCQKVIEKFQRTVLDLLTRASTHLNTQQTDTTQDAQAETTQQQAETTPQQAETTPQQAETTPQQAETTPQQAETTPQQAETTPQQAETTPQQAETTPQQAETTQQTSSDANAQPGPDVVAKSSTDGEGDTEENKAKASVGSETAENNTELNNDPGAVEVEVIGDTQPQDDDNDTEQDEVTESSDKGEKSDPVQEEDKENVSEKQDTQSVESEDKKEKKGSSSSSSTSSSRSQRSSSNTDDVVLEATDVNKPKQRRGTKKSTAAAVKKPAKSAVEETSSKKSASVKKAAKSTVEETPSRRSKRSTAAAKVTDSDDDVFASPATSTRRNTRARRTNKTSDASTQQQSPARSSSRNARTSRKR